MAAAFVIKHNKNALGHQYWWFVFRANNNKIVMQSEMYTSLDAAKNGVACVRKEAAGAEIEYAQTATMPEPIREATSHYLEK